MEQGKHNERLTDREQKLLFERWEQQQQQEVAEQSEPTVKDIAEAYGMPAEEVGRQLRAVRAEEAQRQEASRLRRAGAGRAVRGAIAALVLLGLGWVGVTHLPAIHWPSSSSSAAARHDSTGIRDFEAGNYAAAESEDLLAVREQPNNAAYRINLGNALYAQKKNEEALPQYQEAVQLEPGSAKYEQYVADTLLALDRPEEAATLFRSSLALDSSSGDAESGLGASLAKLGKYAEAEAAFRVSNRLAPANASTLDGLGAAIGEQHRLAEAAGYFREAVALAPGNAQYRNNLDTAEKLLRQGKQ